jgi:hypothetical protein
VHVSRPGQGPESPDSFQTNRTTDQGWRHPGLFSTGLHWLVVNPHSLGFTTHPTAPSSCSEERGAQQSLRRTCPLDRPGRDALTQGCARAATQPPPRCVKNGTSRAPRPRPPTELMVQTKNNRCFSGRRQHRACVDTKQRQPPPSRPPTLPPAGQSGPWDLTGNRGLTKPRLMAGGHLSGVA